MVEREAHFVGSFVILRIAETCSWDLAPGQIAGVSPGVKVFSQQEMLKRSLVPGDETTILCTTNHLQSPMVPWPTGSLFLLSFLSPFVLRGCVHTSFLIFFSISRIMHPFCQGCTLELHSCGFSLYLPDCVTPCLYLPEPHTRVQQQDSCGFPLIPI